MHTSDTHNELPHRADELQDAPRLKALREQLHEEMPKDYFNDFHERLHERMEDEKVLAEAPELLKLGKEMQVDIPEGYFTAFHKRIMQTLMPAPVRSLWERPMVWAAAAGIVLLCTFAVLFQPFTQPASQNEIALEEINDEELLAMVSLVGADAEDIASVFSVEEVGFEDLESFEEDDTDDLLESLDLSEDDILDLLNETY